MADRLSKEQRAQIARDALAMAREIADSLDVDPADLEKMSLEELLAMLADAGVEVDVRALEDAARATLANEVRALDRGIPLDPNAQEQIGAKVASATATVAKQATRDTVRGIRDTAKHDADERPWDEQMYIWISMGEGTCPTCYSRHGDVFAWDQWQDIGMPGGDGTLCGKHCRCELQPVNADRTATERRFEEYRTNLQVPPGA